MTEYERVFVGLTQDQRIEWLRAHGSSLVLSWGEEGWWEVDWQTSGTRYHAAHRSLHSALQQVWEQAEAHRVRSTGA